MEGSHFQKSQKMPAMTLQNRTESVFLSDFQFLFYEILKKQKSEDFTHVQQI